MYADQNEATPTKVQWGGQDRRMSTIEDAQNRLDQSIEKTHAEIGRAHV